jgi:hypothetical protein
MTPRTPEQCLERAASWDRQCGHPIIVTLGPAVFDGNISSIDIASLIQPLAECCRIRRKYGGRCGVKKSDKRHRLLLRAPGGWPSTHRAGN